MLKYIIIMLQMSGFLIVCLFISCSKMDSTYNHFLEGGEIKYSALPDSVFFSPGYNRVKISCYFISDPNVQGVRVSWNNEVNTHDFQVDKIPGNDTSVASILIDSLEEGLYSFDFYSYDRNGNKSIKFDTSLHIYGDIYNSSLRNRSIKNIEELQDSKYIIIWGDEFDEDIIGMEIKYQYVNGDEETKIIQINNTETIIEGDISGDTIQYRTLFLPESFALDTFYSKFQTIKLAKPKPVELDASLFSPYLLDNDADHYQTFTLDYLWDQSLANWHWYRTADGSGSPHSFTMDLGEKTQLTRFIFWQRGVLDEHALLYDNSNVKVMEIWGSNNPSQDGNWDDWTKLLTVNSMKPSGAPLGTVTQEDIDYALAGESYDFSPTLLAYRYIRFNVLKTWNESLSSHSFMAEVAFYGFTE